MKTRGMSFRLIVTLGLLALLLVPVSPVAAANAVSIGVTSAQVVPGSDFIARVNIDSVTDFDAAQFDVTYNSAVIQITSVTAGNISGTTIPVSSWGYVPTGTQGTARIINNVPGTPGITGSGYLAEIYFHVVGAAGTNGAITLSGGVLGDKNAHPITATWTNSAVTVVFAVTTDFSANATQAMVNQSLTFTANPSGGAGGYTYSWSFGDSGTSSSANPAHLYTAPGNYTVTLTVTDSLGSRGARTKTSYITVYAALAADCAANTNEAVVGQTVTFSSTATAGGKPGYTYNWDFKDTGTSNIANPSHFYATSGNYTVSLTVADSLGNTSSITVIVKVYKLADADKNSTVDVFDITYIEHIIMGDSGYVSSSWADANQDGNINALDVSATELIIINL